MDDFFFMERALELARNALSEGEFPVSCVMVHRKKEILTGTRIGTAGASCNEIDHAEMIALRRLNALDWKPDPSGLTLYCTMEPCLMCFGALLIHGIGRIVFAYEDAMGGGTGCDRMSLPPLYRKQGVEIVPHVLRSESLRLFKAFFADPANAYWRGSFLSEYTLGQTD
jgi:tRNA(adenine34) deaminase